MRTCKVEIPGQVAMKASRWQREVLRAIGRAEMMTRVIVSDMTANGWLDERHAQRLDTSRYMTTS